MGGADMSLRLESFGSYCQRHCPRDVECGFQCPAEKECWTVWMAEQKEVKARKGGIYEARSYVWTPHSRR